MSSSGTLMPAVVSLVRFPRTRYQGSKRKLAATIVEQLRDLEFTTVLDAFGGTGAVSHAFKAIGKHVTYNDVLARAARCPALPFANGCCLQIGHGG